MARRSFGSVERLASGRWRGRYTGPDGRVRSAPETFASRADADKWLAMIRADMLRGKWQAPERSDITLADYTTAWLRQRTPQLRPRTLDLYTRVAHRWILSPVGTSHRIDLTHVTLHALTPALVREWHAAVAATATTAAQQRGPAPLTRQHPARLWATSHGLPVAPTGRLSPATVAAWRAAGAPTPTPARVNRPGAGRTSTAQAYRLLHAILTTAVQDRLLEYNPVNITGAGHVTYAERLPLTAQEVTALADAMPPRYAAAILVAAWSGLRPGELAALRRQDLDLATSRITVHQTLVEIPSKPLTFGPPKTAAGRRTIALPAFVIDALRHHLAHHTPPGPHTLIFTTPTGQPLTATTRTKTITKARQHINRPDITWHHLRHTGATLAAQAGATQAELMRRIGHSSTRAAALYQHATQDRDTQLAQALHTLATTH